MISNSGHIIVEESDNENSDQEDDDDDEEEEEEKSTSDDAEELPIFGPPPASPAANACLSTIVVHFRRRDYKSKVVAFTLCYSDGVQVGWRPSRP